MKPLFKLFAGSAIAGLAAGFVLNALMPRDVRLFPGTGPGLPDSGGKGKEPKAGSGKAALSPLAEKLRAGLAGSAGQEAWLRWMAALEKAEPGDFAALVPLAQKFPGALEMLAARWIERDPAGLLALCQDPGLSGPEFPQNFLARQLMITWPLKDPDAVLAALKKPPGLLVALRMPALETLCQNRTEEAVIAMWALDVQVSSPAVTEAVWRWAVPDPRHAAEVLLAHPRGYGPDPLLEAVGQVWAASDPAGALAFAAQTPAFSTDLAREVMRQWVHRDAAQASAWLASAPDQERTRLLPAFVESWGKKDAAGALRWSLDNTSGSECSQLVRALVQGVVTQDPASAAAMVAGLESATLRAQAAQTFAKISTDGLDGAAGGGNGGWWLDFSSGQPVPRPEALGWLTGLDEKSRMSVIGELGFSSWSEGFPKSFAEFLLTPAGQGASEHTLLVVSGNFVRAQPAEALEWAERTPEASRAAVVSGTFQSWRGLQPDTAMDWLARRPADDPYRPDLYLGAVRDIVPASAYGLGSEDDSPMGPPREAPAKLAALLASDPAAAREAIGRLNFTPEERAKILTSFGLTAAAAENRSMQTGPGMPAEAIKAQPRP